MSDWFRFWFYDTQLQFALSSVCKTNDLVFVIQIAGVKKFILFADAKDNSTNYISLDVNYYVSKTLFKRRSQHPIALDFDPVEDRVYWSEVNHCGIFTAFLNRTSVKILFYCNVQDPDGLAIDHVGRNIY